MTRKHNESRSTRETEKAREDDEEEEGIQREVLLCPATSGGSVTARPNRKHRQTAILTDSGEEERPVEERRVTSHMTRGILTISMIVCVCMFFSPLPPSGLRRCAAAARHRSRAAAVSRKRPVCDANTHRKPLSRHRKLLSHLAPYLQHKDVKFHVNAVFLNHLIITDQNGQKKCETAVQSHYSYIYQILNGPCV